MAAVKRSPQETLRAEIARSISKAVKAGVQRQEALTVGIDQLIALKYKDAFDQAKVRRRVANEASRAEHAAADELATERRRKLDQDERSIRAWVEKVFGRETLRVWGKRDKRIYIGEYDGTTIAVYYHEGNGLFLPGHLVLKNPKHESKREEVLSFFGDLCERYRDLTVFPAPLP